ncbi:MAG: hypothetical protein AB4290_05750 [Spirulina sp.]
MTVATEAIKRIESDPTWKQRIVSVLKAGTLKTFEEAIDHPAARVLIAAIEGWKED